MKVRVYGSSIGYGSLARVAAGMCEGLEANDAFAGFVPVDIDDPEAVYAGADAGIAVFSGPMNRVSLMTSTGWHKQRWALLPANSTWIPEELVRSMEAHVTGFVAPSRWAVDVLKNYTQLPIVLYQHGVAKEFRPTEEEWGTIDNGEERWTMSTPMDPGTAFRVLHLASTSRQRKGTRELTQAWTELQDHDRLGANARLVLVLSDPSYVASWHVASWQTIPSTQKAYGIEVHPRLNFDAVSLARLYQRHAFVCQPSRGEGLGLVPLEALACGVPIIATDCTGHSEYMSMRALQGAVVVPTGPLEPIDDGPGAMAPNLSVRDLAKSLVEAYGCRDELRRQALAQAKSIHEAWSWERVTADWLERIQRIREGVSS